MDHSQLADATGKEKAPRIVKGLTTKYDGIFAPAIRMSGRKNSGGYGVSIRLEELRQQ